jgi:hypothetical protein
MIMKILIEEDTRLRNSFWYWWTQWRTIAIEFEHVNQFLGFAIEKGLVKYKDFDDQNIDGASSEDLRMMKVNTFPRKIQLHNT